MVTIFPSVPKLWLSTIVRKVKQNFITSYLNPNPHLHELLSELGNDVFDMAKFRSHHPDELHLCLFILYFISLYPSYLISTTTKSCYTVSSQCIISIIQKTGANKYIFLLSPYKSCLSLPSHWKRVCIPTQ